MRIVLATMILPLLLLPVPGTAAEQTVRVRMVTEYGAIELELYPERAPVTVGNFLRYVEQGLYDGASFYRTVRYGTDRGEPKIEVIQGGIGYGNAAFPPIRHEDTDLTGIRHEDGVVSMSRFELNTATSEFFIVLGDQPGLDKGAQRNPDGEGFAAFGRVVEGMNVVRRIHELPADAPSDSAYTVGQIIEKPARIESVRRIVR